MSEIIISAQPDRREQWAEAFSLWLESRNAESTRRAYKAAWKSFFEFSGKQPWEVKRTDILRWVNDMQAHGLAAKTIQLKTVALSSFFEYATKVYTVEDKYGRETALHNFNPALKLPIKKSTNYKPYWLTPEQVRQLLDVVPRERARGKRDYAILLSYIFLGRRNSEIRKLRWSDFDRRGNAVYYVWSGKGHTNEVAECPPIVWDAICDYLQAVGRLTTIQPDEYIFTALTDRAARLPNVGTGFDPAAQPLSMREVGRILKRYARKARLDPKRIRVHSLRHTAAVLRMLAGDDLMSISGFLGHRNMVVTQVYLHSLTGRQDTSWKNVLKLLDKDN